MPSSFQGPPRVAYCEDAQDDSGSCVDAKPGIRKYAISEPPLSPSKANTSRSRSNSRPLLSGQASAIVPADHADTRDPVDRKEKSPQKPSSDKDRGHPQQRARDRSRQRREKLLQQQEEDRLAAAKEPQSRASRKQRPASLRQANTQPVIQQQHRRERVDDPASYGARQPARSASRPRAQTRPVSYSAGQPHISTSPWDMQSAQFHHATRPFPVGSYPPPVWQAPGAPPPGYGAPFPTGYTAAPFDRAGPADSHNRLRLRFENRPTSAMDFLRPPQPAPPVDYYHGDYLEEPPLTQPSHRARQPRTIEEDRRRMPPPETPLRPRSAFAPDMPFPPPNVPRPSQWRSRSRPPPSQRRAVEFAEEVEYDDDDPDDEHALFHDNSPNVPYEQRHPMMPRPGRSSWYDHQTLDMVPAAGRNRRPSHGGINTSAFRRLTLDDKMSQAVKYQDLVNGTPKPLLTAESLRRAARRGDAGTSRSTRSSGSHDGSEYRRSNALGITRASNNGSDDLTITLTGNALLRLPGGAEITCEDSRGEVTLTGRQGSSRNGSDQASVSYPLLESNRSRAERTGLPQRVRDPSQSDSQSRGYVPSHAPYCHARNVYYDDL